MQGTNGRYRQSPDIDRVIGGLVARRSKKCIFCGQRNARSAEDAWPWWVRREFAEVTDRTHFSNSPTQMVRTAKSRGPKRIINSVCKVCNLGWLSDLESDVAPILKPMIAGQPGFLTADVQRLIAFW